MPASPAPKPRRRDAAATRERILASARKLFVKLGYDGVGVREIAAGAGVTAMMVNRYFGSKEALFAEVTGSVMQDRTLFTPEVLGAADLGAALTEAILEVTKPGAPPSEALLILLHSASTIESDTSAKVEINWREWVRQGREAAIEAAIKGGHTAARATILQALIVGLMVMRQRMRIPALVNTRSADLAGILTPMLRALVEPEKER